MTRNVKLHYFSSYYHASNFLMQGTSFYLMFENISQKLNRTEYELCEFFFLFFNVKMLLYVSQRVLDTVM